MKRFTSLLVATAIASFVLVGVLAGTAHAKMCGTFTKKEASKIIGYKVVETEELTEESTDTEGCEYITKKQFKDVSSPLKLRITAQPLNDDTAAALDELEADEDAEPVPDLGDRAFYTDGNELIAVSGDQVFQAKITNVRWRNNELETLIKAPELAAMRQLIDDAG
jgi:hypothetical protein